MSTLRLTEQPSLYDHLEKKSVAEIIHDINEEDKKVPMAIENALPELEKIISAIEHQLRNGGRMFYVGCGTGGRLSVLDQVVCLVEYMPDGSTHNMLRQYYRNPNGFRYGRLVTLSGPTVLKGRLKTYVHYAAESVLAGKPIVRDAPSKLLGLLSIPFGHALAWYIRKRCR